MLGTCLERGIKIVSNAGGLNPAGLAAAIDGARAAARSPTSRATTCAARSARSPRRSAASRCRPTPTSAAGASPRRWQAGADVVVTGRVTDASLVVGPGRVVARLGPDDWDALAGAVVAGHVIECGPQATGGNYAFLDEITDRRYPGFPIAEVAADGSSVITKHPGTGGLVSVGTVTAQLLYEIAGPAYLGPDVTTHFDTIALAPGRRAPRRDHRGAGEPAARHAQGGPQRRRRLPQHDDARAHRPGRRGQGRAGRGAAVRGARRPRAVRRGRRAAAALRPAGRADQRAGHRAPAHHREGPRPAQGGRAFSNATMELALGGYAGFHTTTPPTRRVGVRRLLARRRAARGRDAARSCCRAASGA